MAIINALTDTWNNVATTFSAIKMDVTDTTSAAGSLLLDLKVGGTQMFAIRKDGSAQWGSASNRIFYSAGAGGLVVDVGGATRLVFQTGGLDLGGSNDTFVKRVSASMVGIYTSNASATFGDLSNRHHVMSGFCATNAAAPTIASAATIAPTTAIAFVSGTTTISTITAPSPISAGGGQITLIPTGLWSTNTAGNIALATTGVVSRALTLTYDVTTTKWYPSY